MVRNKTKSRMTSAKQETDEGFYMPTRMVGINLCSDSERVSSMDACDLLRTCVGGHGRPSTRLFLMLIMLVLSVVIVAPSYATQFQPMPQANSAGRRMVPMLQQGQMDEPTAEELAAARGLEMMLMDQMIQQMRQTVPENEFMPQSQGEKIFRSMLDSEYARIISETGGVGVADLVLAQIRGKR